MKSDIDKQKKLIKQRRDEQKQLQHLWHEFLERDTYLTFEEKAIFLKEIKVLRRYSLYLIVNPISHSKIKRNREILNELRREIRKYNNTFIERRLSVKGVRFKGSSFLMSLMIFSNSLFGFATQSRDQILQIVQPNDSKNS